MSQSQNIRFEALIHILRGQKVMLDYDLARLYGVETKVLNQAVKRHIERFPFDFMFQLTEIETQFTRRSQIVTASQLFANPRFRPHAFTELGVAMLSSVLRSEQAVQVNISIMRTFFAMRDLIQKEENADSKIKALEKNTSDLFKLVFERINRLEKNTPILSPHRRKIGF